MKLIPDSNSQNKYNEKLQNVVNTFVTIAVVLATVIVASFAVLGAKVAFSDLDNLSFFRVGPSVVVKEICYDNAYVGNYVTNREELEIVTGYTENYLDFNNLDTAGIVITNEMLMAMSEENNLLRPDYDIRGFHLYFAHKLPNGGTPSIVFVPFGPNFSEFSPDLYRVLEVSERVCAPCPLLCDDFDL